MTREQFLAYQRAKDLEKFIRPANDNLKTDATHVYGFQEGVIFTCITICGIMIIICLIWGL
jgi:hypothetical protein